MQPFVKVVKNKAYFKRFQVKFRRRRGKKLSQSERGERMESLVEIMIVTLTPKLFEHVLQRVALTIVNATS